MRTPPTSPQPLGQLIDVGGYRVHLYCIGKGDPAVIIVGAGFSFDWGLVQPEVAKSTRVCSYDHSGIGWSETGPADSCTLRVNEIHTALRNAHIEGPFVLVGHSLGAVIVRLYAARYPEEMAGVVFVDHAFWPSNLKVLVPKSAPLSPSSIALGLESDPNFTKLSPRDRDLHSWAISQGRNQIAVQTNTQIMPQCVADAETALREHSFPLGDKPVIDVSTGMGSSGGTDSREYTALQARLLTLSKNSTQVIAANSGHFIIIDRPDVVIGSINRVVNSFRHHKRL